MLSLGEYTIGWLVYGTGVVGLLLVSWRLFRAFSWSYLRRIILLTIAVLLLTPAMGEENYWAPAWIIGGLEVLFGGGIENLMNVGRIVLFVWLVVVIFYTLVSLLFLRNKKVTPKPPRKEPTVGKKIPRRRPA